MNTQLSTLFDEDSRLALIAMEMAQNLREPEDILETYGMTKEEFAKAGRTPLFKSMFREQRIAWTSPGNTSERTKHQAQMSIEHLMPKMHRWASDEEASSMVRLGWVKQIAVFAGYNEKKPQEQDLKASEPFVLNIIIPQPDGSERQEVIRGRTPVTLDHE